MESACSTCTQCKFCIDERVTFTAGDQNGTLVTRILVTLRLPLVPDISEHSRSGRFDSFVNATELLQLSFVEVEVD